MDPEWWDRVEYGRFKLSEFRWHAAAVIKYLIRAREKVTVNKSTVTSQRACGPCGDIGGELGLRGILRSSR